MTREWINQDSHVGHRDLESVDERFQQLGGNRRISQ